MCDFGTDTDNQIRDAVLNKCTSNYIKRQLLEEGQGLNLTRTVEVAAKREKIETQLVALSVKGKESESIIKSMREVPIRALAHKGDSKGEIRYVIHVVYCDISVGIPSAQQEAKHVESVVSQCRLRVVLTVQ